MAFKWGTSGGLQTATSGVEWDSMVGTVSISTTVKRTSTATSIRTNPTAGAGHVSHQYLGAGVATNRYYRAYLYIATAPATDALAIMLFRDGTNGNGPSIRLNSNRTLELWDEQATAQRGSDSSALSLNTWYRIELEYVRSTGAITAYIDGVSFATGSTTATMDMNVVRFGMIDSATCDLHWADVAVADSSGSVDNSLIGAGNFAYMVPNATGDNSQWQDDASGTQGTSLYTNVNETTPDDVTTYNKRTTTTPTSVPVDDWNVVSSSSVGINSTDTVRSVAVGFRGGAISTTSGTNRQLDLRLKSAASGTLTTATAIPIHVNGWTTHRQSAPKVYQLVSYTDPTTGSAWTPTGTNSLDNMQIGYSGSVSSTTEIRVGTIWALVHFTPATSVVVTPGVVSLTLSTFAPVVTATDNKSVTPGTASLTITTFVPGIAVSDNQSVTPSTATLILTTFAPTVTATNNITVTPGTLGLTLTTYSPVVTATDNKSVTPGTLGLTLNAFAPNIIVSDNQVVTPGTGSPTITLHAPNVVVGTVVSPQTAALSITGYAPDVEFTANVTVTPGTRTLSLTTFRPTIKISGLPRKYYIDSDGDVYWVISQELGLVEKV